MSDRIQSSNLGTLTQELLASAVPMTAEDTGDVISALGWKPTGACMLVAAIWRKAVSGDVNSAKLIREMNGEIEADNTAVDLSGMSDAMLRRMAEGTEINPTTAGAVPLPLGKGGKEKEYEVPW